VAVNDHLTCLSHGASKSGAQDKRIESHFEKLDQILTGEALALAGLFEDATQLCFADAVLGPQALLLAKTHGVVTVGLALGTTVLTGSIRALF
jgi:hypothetical protein